MLPDFPLLKNDISNRLQTFLRLRAHKHLGPGLNEIPRTTIHEGNKHVMVRSSGEVEEVKTFKATAEFEIKTAELRNLSFPEILRRYDEIAQSIAKQQAQKMFETIDEAVAKVGNVVDGGGKKFSADLFYKLLDRIQIDFDSDGKPIFPQMIVGPGAKDSIASVFQEIDSDSNLVKKFNLLIDRKKDEWRAREANRSLVG